jgi:hypothetical protein
LAQGHYERVKQDTVSAQRSAVPAALASIRLRAPYVDVDPDVDCDERTAAAYAPPPRPHTPSPETVSPDRMPALPRDASADSIVDLAGGRVSSTAFMARLQSTDSGVGSSGDASRSASSTAGADAVKEVDLRNLRLHPRSCPCAFFVLAGVGAAYC